MVEDFLAECIKDTNQLAEADFRGEWTGLGMQLGENAPEFMPQLGSG